MSNSLRNLTRKFGAVWALALAALLSGPVAHAEPILLAAGSSLSNGKQSWSTDLQLNSPGTLNVRVSDLGVPLTIVDRLAGLSFSVANTSTSAVFGSMGGESLLSVNIDIAGPYSLFISAVPASRFNLGLVSWNATFEPSVAAVPLPPAVLLLISGLVWATGLQRKRAILGRNEGNRFLWWGAQPAH
jgi:hypothetical protein